MKFMDKNNGSVTVQNVKNHIIRSQNMYRVGINLGGTNIKAGIIGVANLQ